MKSKNQPAKGTQTIDVARLHSPHPRIRAADWRSPLVRRLLSEAPYRDGEAVVTDSYKDEAGVETNGGLTLKWVGLGHDVTLCDNTYQAPVLTEFAALGLACILTHLRAKLEITEVTRRGERVDYWLGDKEFVLEVSGTHGGSLETLCKDKTDQLRLNPFEKDGYVCVAEFKSALARLWYCGVSP